jgi:hypothetical protein
MIKKLGPMITFRTLRGMCILGSIIIAFIVPETTESHAKKFNWI